MMFLETWYWPPATVLLMMTVTSLVQGILCVVLLAELPRGGGRFRALRGLIALMAFLSLGTAVSAFKLTQLSAASPDEILWRLMGVATLMRLCAVSIGVWAVAFLAHQKRAAGERLSAR